ncbi:MAG: amidohydrolase, partial [Bacteroidia bacterium]|nr:amidohydrolase [Bacteroidia bacterium]
MKKLLLLLLSLALTQTMKSQRMSSSKKAIVASVEAHKEKLIAISDSIWALAETAFEEDDSAEILASYAEKNGFTVQRGVAGMPTAFVATYGSGSP